MCAREAAESLLRGTLKTRDRKVRLSYVRDLFGSADS